LQPEGGRSPSGDTIALIAAIGERIARGSTIGWP